MLLALGQSSERNIVMRRMAIGAETCATSYKRSPITFWRASMPLAYASSRRLARSRQVWAKWTRAVGEHTSIVWTRQNARARALTRRQTRLPLRRRTRKCARARARGRQRWRLRFEGRRKLRRRGTLENSLGRRRPRRDTPAFRRVTLSVAVGDFEWRRRRRPRQRWRASSRIVATARGTLSTRDNDAPLERSPCPRKRAEQEFAAVGSCDLQASGGGRRLASAINRLYDAQIGGGGAQR